MISAAVDERSSSSSSSSSSAFFPFSNRALELDNGWMDRWMNYEDL